jgi:hypothetical protein
VSNFWVLGKVSLNLPSVRENILGKEDIHGKDKKIHSVKKKYTVNIAFAECPILTIEMDLCRVSKLDIQQRLPLHE